MPIDRTDVEEREARIDAIIEGCRATRSPGRVMRLRALSKPRDDAAGARARANPRATPRATLADGPMTGGNERLGEAGRASQRGIRL